MGRKQIALLAALLGTATPGHAFDTQHEAQSVMFYYAIPLDARTDKERIPWMGMQINGKRDYQSFNVDTRLLTFAPLGALEAKMLIGGALAVGAAAAVGHRGKSQQQQVSQEQQAQPARPPTTPGTPGTPCTC